MLISVSEYMVKNHISLNGIRRVIPGIAPSTISLWINKRAKLPDKYVRPMSMLLSTDRKNIINAQIEDTVVIDKKILNLIRTRHELSATGMLRMKSIKQRTSHNKPLSDCLAQQTNLFLKEYLLTKRDFKRLSGMPQSTLYKWLIGIRILPEKYLNKLDLIMSIYQKRYDEAMKAAVMKEHKEGAKLTDLSSKYDIGYSSLVEWKRPKPSKMMPKKFTDDIITQVLKDLESGKSGVSICKKYNMSDSRLYTLKKEFGIATRQVDTSYLQRKIQERSRLPEFDGILPVGNKKVK